MKIRQCEAKMPTRSESLKYQVQILNVDRVLSLRVFGIKKNPGNMKRTSFYLGRMLDEGSRLNRVSRFVFFLLFCVGYR